MSDLDSLSYECVLSAKIQDCNADNTTGRIRKRKSPLIQSPGDNQDSTEAIETNTDKQQSPSALNLEQDENISLNSHTNPHPHTICCVSTKSPKKIRLIDSNDNALTGFEGDIRDDERCDASCGEESPFHAALYNPDAPASFIASALPRKHIYSAASTGLHSRKSRAFPELSDEDSDVPEDELYVQSLGEENCTSDGYLGSATQNELENSHESVEEKDEQETPEVEGEIDVYEFMASLPPIPAAFQNRPPCIPPRHEKSPPVTLVLDLDETLVHCSIEPTDDSDFDFPVNFGNQDFQVYAKIRPFCSYFLEQVSRHYEVVIFTASQQVYADKVLDIIDPQRLYISHRVFREHCVVVDGNYVKDLNILGRNLSKVAIVDNSPQVFGYQVDNGIPIESWYGDRSDQELLYLLPFLLMLPIGKDIRPQIAKRFGMYDRIFQGRAAPEHLQRRFCTPDDAEGAGPSGPL